MGGRIATKIVAGSRVPDQSCLISA